MAKLRNPQPTMVIDATEESTMNATQRTPTQRAGLRRLVALAALVALLLALATAAALRQASTIRPASRAPAAPALAHDGYAPTRLDYREDHRLSAPAYGTDSANYREEHRPDAPARNAAPSAVPCPGRDLALAGACAPAGDKAPQAPVAAPAQSGVPPCLTADGVFCGSPASGGTDASAALPDTPRQQQRLASLDATLYGPAAPGERTPAAWPGYHCGAVPPPGGQVCDNESPRFAPQSPAPAPGPSQRERPARLDARDYGPAAGGAAPVCNGDAAAIGNACDIP